MITTSRIRTLSELAAWHDEQLTLIGEGRPERLHAVAASANVFRTLNVDPTLGRGFAEGEDRSGHNRVVVLAHAFWQRSFGGDPQIVGKTVTLDPRQRPGRARRRGRAPGARLSRESANRFVTVRGLQDELIAGVRPALLMLFGAVGFVLLIACADWATVLADALQSIDRQLPIGVTGTMAEAVHDSLARQRLSTMLLGIFGALALVLALMGIYGVMSYIVSQRGHEIGIRMALGARAGTVTRMIVGHALALAAIGVALGLAAALALARLLDNLLYGVAAWDVPVFALIGVSLVGISGLAAYRPARRAARVDPMATLRTS